MGRGFFHSKTMKKCETLTGTHWSNLGVCESCCDHRRKHSDHLRNHRGPPWKILYFFFFSKCRSRAKINWKWPKIEWKMKWKSIKIRLKIDLKSSQNRWKIRWKFDQKLSQNWLKIGRNLKWKSLQNRSEIAPKSIQNRSKNRRVHEMKTASKIDLKSMKTRSKLDPKSVKNRTESEMKFASKSINNRSEIDPQSIPKSKGAWNENRFKIDKSSSEIEMQNVQNEVHHKSCWLPRFEARRNEKDEVISTWRERTKPTPQNGERWTDMKKRSSIDEKSFSMIDDVWSRSIQFIADRTAKYALSANGNNEE